MYRVIPPQVQDPAVALVELHYVDLSPTLQVYLCPSVVVSFPPTLMGCSIQGVTPLSVSHNNTMEKQIVKGSAPEH